MHKRGLFSWKEKIDLSTFVFHWLFYQKYTTQNHCLLFWVGPGGIGLDMVILYFQDLLLLQVYQRQHIFFTTDDTEFCFIWLCVWISTLNVLCTGLEQCFSFSLGCYFFFKQNRTAFWHIFLQHTKSHTHVCQHGSQPVSQTHIHTHTDTPHMHTQYPVNTTKHSELEQ